jgi:histidinol-phosphatase
VVGAVNVPGLGDFLSAAKGQGCQWNGRAARVSDAARLADATLLCTDPEQMGPAGRAAEFRRLVDASKMFRGWSDAYGYVLVATGRAEVMLDPEMNAWDCAALLPVVQEAGGTFTDWDGVPTIHGGNAIATNGRVFEEVLRLVRGA